MLSLKRIFTLIIIILGIVYRTDAEIINTIVLSNDSDIQLQFNVPKAKYIVKFNLDLKGQKITVPPGSSICFSNGTISNGIIKGQSTKFVGKTRKRFSNVDFLGSFDVTHLTYKSFSNYSSDTELLRAMFDLLFLSNGYCTLELEKNGFYNVNSKQLGYAHSIFEFRGKKNKTIYGNNSVINDQRKRELVSYKTYDGVLLFADCHNIKISNLNYQNINEDYKKIIENGNIKYKEGIENQIGYVGTSFILLQDDCSGFDIHSNIIGARYGVKSGDYSKFWLSGNYGLKNSRLYITANRTGYPVAIEVGDSLDIYVYSTIHHRAAYLCGISNSSINIEAKDIYIAPFHCLLSDTHYSKGNKFKANFKSCYNLKVRIIELGSTIATNGDCYCAGFQTYNTAPFRLRKAPLVWKNIFISIIKKAAADKVGLFSLDRNLSSDKNDPLQLCDIYRNICIQGEDRYPSSQYGLRVRVNKYGEYDDVCFKINAPNSDAICDSQNIYNFKFESSSFSHVNYSCSHLLSTDSIKKK